MKTNEGIKGVVAHVMCEKYIKLKVTRTCLLSRFLRGFKNQLVVSDCSQNAHMIKKRLVSYNYEALLRQLWGLESFTITV